MEVEEGRGLGGNLGFGECWAEWKRVWDGIAVSSPEEGVRTGVMQGSPSGSSRRASPRCCSAVRKALCRL